MFLHPGRDPHGTFQNVHGFLEDQPLPKTNPPRLPWFLQLPMVCGVVAGSWLSTRSAGVLAPRSLLRSGGETGVHLALKPLRVFGSAWLAQWFLVFKVLARTLGRARFAARLGGTARSGRLRGDLLARRPSRGSTAQGCGREQQVLRTGHW